MHSNVGFITALPFESAAVVHFWARETVLDEYQNLHLYRLKTGILLFEVGMGLRNASVLQEWLERHGLRQLFNVGISGALVPFFSIGDIVPIRAAVLANRKPIELSIVPKIAIPPSVQVTVSRPVETRSWAMHLHQETGANLVDMELFYIADIVQTLGNISLYSLRVVSDFADLNARRSVQRNLPILKQKLRDAVALIKTSGLLG